MALNINNVVAKSRSNFILTNSIHKCATYVRICLERGGFNSDGHPRLAKNYDKFLPHRGFKEIAVLYTEDQRAVFTRDKAQLCDIAVFKHPVTPSAPGHICLWNGANWTSDFRQRRMNVYSQDVEAHIFRYTGEVDDSPVDPSIYNESSSSGGGDSSFGGGGGTRGSNFLGQKHMTNEELNKDMSNREELISFLRTTKSEIPDTPPPMVITKNKSTLEHDSITIERMD